jgi:hypothetical protein
MFIERAKYIAYRQLWDNLKIAEAEGARYGVTTNPNWGKKGVDRPYVPGKPAPEEAPAVRAAAKELIGYRTKREEAERKFHPFSHMEDEYEAGKTNPTPSGAMALQDAENAEREASHPDRPRSSRSSSAPTSTRSPTYPTTRCPNRSRDQPLTLTTTSSRPSP